MIGRWEARLRKLRRFVSRNEWLVRILGLTRHLGTETERGLVMIQIDGLGRGQLETALSCRRMPFLKRLIEKERYALRTFYSGLPSSTPAVQGELFYGIECAVPAFSFRDSTNGQIVCMFEPEPAAAVQKHLEQCGEGLLRGGSAYSDIFSGGANESHFCPSTTGFDELWRTANPLAILLALVWHAPSFLKTAALMGIELVLAAVDAVRGLIAGRDLLKELKFVPSRVLISILLRELVTNGAMLDATRGVPVVHLNYLGYDEQAHRRGPESAFAHWSLKGIDRAIAKVWRAARASRRRDYDIWIYSDHGQERTVPYPRGSGRTVHEAVADVFRGTVDGKPVNDRWLARGVQSKRAQWLGGRLWSWFLGGEGPSDPSPDSPVSVAAMGPVGFVYTDFQIEPEERQRLVQRLVDVAKIPNVLVPTEPGKVSVWNQRGRFELPDDADEVLGPDHPLRDQVARDLVGLCHHQDAGDFVLCGWSRDAPAVSFPIENGAHAGPGPNETSGFALLPADVHAIPAPGGHIRPHELRAMALHVLGRGRRPSTASTAKPRRPSHTLRILTYNVHGCLGMDGKLSPARIARVIAQCDPDVVALQELDCRRPRSGSADQAHEIAHDLEMQFHFHPAMRIEEEEYGDAILSRLPMRLVRAEALPGAPGARAGEPRGAIWVAVEAYGLVIQVLNTHLGLGPRERMAQVDALMGPDWLTHPNCRRPVVLCGDFNALPSSRPHQRLVQRLRDTQQEVDNHRPRRTWFSRFPLGRIDYVFVDGAVAVGEIEVPNNDLTRTASDHLPLLVELRLDDGSRD